MRYWEILEHTSQDVRPPLTEAMKQLNDLALFLSPLNEMGLGGFVVLYDPVASNPTKPAAGVIGCAIFHQLREGFWIVGSILCKDGYGPLVYAIVAEEAVKASAIVIPSDSRSAAAKRTWSKFAENPYVRVVQIPDETGARGPFNRSPTGSGIVGDGSLDMNSATALDQETKNHLGERWHEMMIHAARAALKKAMDQL